jgi:hypothetical protein
MSNAKKIDEFLATNEPRMGKGKRPKEVQSNITDNESAKMTTLKGTIQGMVCVTASDEKHQIIIESQVFGQGQEQSTLKPMVEVIRERHGENVFDTSVVLTADTGFSSEENINAVLLDNQSRKRNPVFAESTIYNQHKEHRKKTRKDRSQGKAVIPSSEFSDNLNRNTCICPAGKEMLYKGNEFKGVGGEYTRFKGKLNDCRPCALQSECMMNPIKENGRQVSFLNAVQAKTSYLDLMKQKNRW